MKPRAPVPRGELMRATLRAEAHRALVALLALGWGGQPPMEVEAESGPVKVRIVCSSIRIGQRRTKVNTAIDVLRNDNTLTVQEIADTVHCSKNNLYRSKRFMQEYLATFREPRRGFHDGGNIDAPS